MTHGRAPLSHKGARYGLLLILVAVAVAGCMPGGGAMANPGWTVVTVEDDVIYAALSIGKVVALDATQMGQEIWAYPAEEQRSGGIGRILSRPPEDAAGGPLDAVYGLPVLTENMVIVASYDRHLYGFDRSSGERRLDFAVEDENGAIIGGVTLRDSIAYFGSADHKVYAFDLVSEQPAWGRPFTTGNRVWGAPALDEDRVYIGSMDHYVYAINRQTGAEEWRTNVSGSVPGNITLADGVLFVGAVDKKLHAIDAEDGSELWQSDELGGWVWGEALVRDGYVYFGTLDGKVHGLDVADGSPRWTSSTVNGAVRAGPAWVEGFLVIGTDSGAVYTVEAETGRLRERFKAEGGVLSTPSVVDKMVYLGTTAGKVYALDLERGIDPQVWVYPPAKDK